eukprot:gnl/MRDRNA2_/MRDRNA2_19969_c0_seq1.p1 gnl/MRDRNA2_/MRDRNA2_19969_c0~~gnl/MRDRNA2_/MRDRNA2_19969_c0_seq1.p1  ORF type:complete len:151 (+),score=40.87 gnl/MRDRNA2_/MRDRNA2_19969_c0_seq1:62-514(+)
MFARAAFLGIAFVTQTQHFGVRHLTVRAADIHEHEFVAEDGHIITGAEFDAVSLSELTEAAASLRRVTEEVDEDNEVAMQLTSMCDSLDDEISQAKDALEHGNDKAADNLLTGALSKLNDAHQFVQRFLEQLEKSDLNKDEMAVRGSDEL